MYKKAARQNGRFFVFLTQSLTLALGFGCGRVAGCWPIGA